MKETRPYVTSVSNRGHLSIVYKQPINRTIELQPLQNFVISVDSRCAITAMLSPLHSWLEVAVKNYNILTQYSDSIHTNVSFGNSTCRMLRSRRMS